MTPLVPAAFEVPAPLHTTLFELEPLGPEHNERDHDAWTSSVDHIRRTPGFAGRQWPGAPTDLQDNCQALLSHSRDAQQRTGFAYAVLEHSTRAYVGCVYFYPPRSPGYDVDVRSWVRADRAELDEPLHDAVLGWLQAAWPWQRLDYAPRRVDEQSLPVDINSPPASAAAAAAAEMTAVHATAARVAYAHIFDSAFPEQEALLKWSGQHEQVALARQGGVLVGFATRTGDELTGLYVLPQVQGQGVGGRLLDAVGTVRRLWVLEGNTRGRAWYEHRGWVDSGKRKTDFGVRDLMYVRHDSDQPRVPA